MNVSERDRLQRLLALVSLGLTEAIKEGAVSHDEAERILFSPYVMSCCKRLCALPQLVEAVHIGTELDAIQRLVSDEEWCDSLATIRVHACTVLTQTQPSDPQLEHWLKPLVSLCTSTTE